MFSPIVLFVYNRPEHTRLTVEALLQNAEAAESALFIFSDAAKNDSSSSDVSAVRDYIRTITGFKSVHIIERQSNLGLANSIIDGVTQLCKQFGRVIVLEDDLIVSKYFLSYMNDALNKYQDEKSVWHISGWNYPIEPNGISDAFFWRTMNCWGWATWDDRWQHFSKNPKTLIDNWSINDIKSFNVDGAYNFWRQVKLNHRGKLNTWAIFWYATIFQYNGLCLNPTITQVVNIGHDGSGENCRDSDHFSSNFSIELVKKLSLPSSVVVSDIAVTRIKHFLSKNDKKNPAFYFLRKCQMLLETYF